MTNHRVMLDLDDPRTAGIAEVLANKTCKKILIALAEQEMGESELSTKLDLPLTTVSYNVMKLVEAGLIEETGKVLWSVKGKRVKRYTVSEKTLVISPRSKFKGILSTAVISGLIAMGIGYWQKSQVAVQETLNQVNQYGIESSKMAMLASDSAASGTISTVTQTAQINPGLWFIFGSLVALIVLLVLNWRKI